MQNHGYFIYGKIQFAFNDVLKIKIALIYEIHYRTELL